MADKSTIVVFIVVFSILGLLLGFAEVAPKENPVVQVLTLETDKTEYRVGEKVTFTATNVGDYELLFAYPSMQLNLENLDTHSKYRVISGQVFVSLKPDESKTLQWNENRDGKLEAGRYVGQIRTSPAGGDVITVQTFFRVVQ